MLQAILSSIFAAFFLKNFSVLAHRSLMHIKYFYDTETVKKKHFVSCFAVRCFIQVTRRFCPIFLHLTSFEYLNFSYG